MAYYASKVLQIAEAEIGYLEKETPDNLDSPTANAGDGNFTKYARDLDNVSGFFNGKKNGYSWCAVFVCWCLYKAFGAAAAKALTFQPDKSLAAGCRYARDYYKAAGRFYTKNPQPGDQIFFGTESNIYHTGLVYKVTKSYVHTIEGNTSGASGVVANGGGVCKKSYYIDSSAILGYGRPKYDAEGATPAPEVKKATVTLQQVQKGSEGKMVRVLQTCLNSFGGAGITVDGDFGSQTDTAVRAYQKAAGLTVDGIVGAQTWTALLTTG